MARRVGILVLLLIGAGNVDGQGLEITLRSLDIHIHNVTIVDVEGGELLRNHTVVLRGDRIEQIAPVAEAPDLAAALLVDGTGRYLIPGLFDSHVHFVPGARTFGPLFVAAGVTFVRDMGAATDAVLSLRDDQRQRLLIAPEMIASGKMIDGGSPVWSYAFPCTTPEESRKAVRKLHGDGVDFIKVYSLLDRDVYFAAVEEAHALGMKVAGHIPETLGVEDAVAAGQDCHEHLTGFENTIARLLGRPVGSMGFEESWRQYPSVARNALRGVLEKVRDSGMVECPTVVTMKNLEKLAQPGAWDDPRLRYVPTAMREHWRDPHYRGYARVGRSMWKHMVDVVGEMHRMGIPIVAGTDAGSPFSIAGFSLHEELELLHSAGLSPADVLRSATIVPARLCGVEERLGSIAVGKTASLVLLAANPLESPSNLSSVEAVFLRGEYFDRIGLDAMLRHVEDGGVAGTLAGLSEPLSRGRFRLTESKPSAGPGASTEGSTPSGQYEDAGEEEFLITGGASSYTLRLRRRSNYGTMALDSLELELDRSWNLRYINWQASSLRIQVALFGDRISYSVIRGNDAISRSENLELKNPPAFDCFALSPAAATLEPLVRSLTLAVGEECKLDLVGFDTRRWRPTRRTVWVERGADAALDQASDAEVLTRVYSVHSLEGGIHVAKIWTDDRSRVIRSEFVQPPTSVPRRAERD